MERKLLPKSPVVQFRQQSMMRVDLFVGSALLNNAVEHAKLHTSFSLGPPPTMFSAFAIVLVCSLALTLSRSQQNAGNDTPHVSPIDFRLPNNISDDEATIQLNASNKLQIQCDGDKYGFNPDVADCQDARSFYKRSSQLFTYGERHSGHGSNVFPLPYRLMGGML